MRPTFGPIPIVSILVALGIGSILVPEAGAVSRIREEIWSYQGQVPRTPASTLVSVSFFANVGDMDLPSRVLFHVGVADAEGAEAPLLQYRWGQWEEIAQPGTPITVYASFRLSCDGNGLVTAEPVETWFGFCSFGSIEMDVRNLDNVQTHAVQTSSNFGLYLEDRGGFRGSKPTPLSAFGCSGNAVGKSMTLEQAHEEMSLLKSRAANRVQGVDPGSIGLYFDSQGRSCSGTIRPGEPDTVFVIAKMRGMSECGIAGAEFRFTGVPDGWTTHSVPQPELLVVGDPMLDGTTVGFRCEHPESGSILLYRVVVVASEEVDDLQFQVESRESPTSPDFLCPLLVLCDYPAFTKVCVEGWTCQVNSTAPQRPCATPVAVTTATWTQIKTLYR